MTGVCFFGGYDPHYPRSDVIRKGLGRLGVEVSECRASERSKVFVRYPVLLSRYARAARAFEAIFVPEFRHKDVPLARAISSLSGKLCVFDPLVSRYDTKIRDRGQSRDRTFQAWHNRNLDRWSMSLPDLLIADTQAHADYYRRHFAAPAQRIAVVPVGYDDDVFQATPYAPNDGTFRVLFFGNYHPLHGADVIARAAALLREEDIHFDMIGEGQTFVAVEEIVASERLQNVTLHRRVPFEELSKRITSADLCLGIFGATDKAARVVPNKVYQTFGAGRALLTMDSPAIREWFTDGQDVALCRGADAGALASAIRALCVDRERVADLARRAAGTARERFGPEEIARRFVRACESAVNRMSTDD